MDGSSGHHGVFLIRGLAQFIGQYALAKIANEGMLLLRKALFERVLAAEMGLFGRQSASALSEHGGVRSAERLQPAGASASGLSRDGFTLIALLGYLLYLNWQLTLIVAVVVPGVAWIMKPCHAVCTSSPNSASKPPMNSPTWWKKTYWPTAWCACTVPSKARPFGALSQSLRRLAIKSTIASAAMTPLTQLLAAAALSVVICIALWQSRGVVDSKDVTVGGFVRSSPRC